MNKKVIRLTESDLHRIIKESVNRILMEAKRQPRQGKINFNGEWVDATEDGLDKNGNPMYKIKGDVQTNRGRKCKDGTRRVQDYTFRPNRKD